MVQVLFVLWGFHRLYGFGFLGVWLHSFVAEDVANITDVVTFNLAFIFVEAEVLLSCPFQHFFEHCIMLLLILCPYQNVVNDNFYSLNVTEYVCHDGLKDILGR